MALSQLSVAHPSPYAYADPLMFNAPLGGSAGSAQSPVKVSQLVPDTRWAAPALPLPPLLMFDRISEIAEAGGQYGKGLVRAVLELKPDLWFFPCHFKGDPVMPGCLGLDALWQLLGFFLGWLGAPGRGRALGLGELKFSGQVLPTVKKVVYGIDIKRVMRSKLVLGIADGWLSADGSIIYRAMDLKVGLFRDQEVLQPSAG